MNRLKRFFDGMYDPSSDVYRFLWGMKRTKMEAKAVYFRCDYLDCLRPFEKPPLMVGFELRGRTIGLHFCDPLCSWLTSLLLEKEYDLEQHWKDKGWHAHATCKPWKKESLGGSPYTISI